MKLKFSNIPDSRFIKSQLERGMKVEREHVTSDRNAKDIAKAHLIETGWLTTTGKYTSHYYDALSVMESRLKRKAQKMRKGKKWE
jgi:hypothetical protein